MDYSEDCDKKQVGIVSNKKTRPLLDYVHPPLTQ